MQSGQDDDDDDSSSLGRPNLSQNLRSTDSQDEGVDVKNLLALLNLHSWIFEREVNCLRMCSNQADFEATSKTGRRIPNPEIEAGERRRKAWQFATKLTSKATHGEEGHTVQEGKQVWRKDKYVMLEKVQHFLKMTNKQKPVTSFLSLFSKNETKNAFF